MSAIVLATLNARYIHSSFGLRYLKANLGELEDDCEIQEFTLETRPIDVVEALLLSAPKIVGLSVYIWNVRQTEQVAALLKAVAPEVLVVMGGPEVSYEQETQSIVRYADAVISGWGEVSFRKLAEQVLSGLAINQKFISGEQTKLDDLVTPYHLYTDQDIAHRVLYVEASRGCPFKCEFCLSALDKTAWPFDLDKFLDEMDDLYQRGTRHFKFVDRTFNLKVKNSIRILDFFLERMSDDLFLHFEVVPDHLPDALKEKIKLFPKGSLQFEVGIQTFNPEVQARISRKQNNELAQQNLEWILANTQAYVHADLIFGLPGETLDSFAQSFDRLYNLKPHEIQVGILKRLKGSPIIRHSEEFGMVFNPEPPFNILASRDFDFLCAQEIARFARFWDLIANSGRFQLTLPALLEGAPFERFMQISQAIFKASGQTHKISLLRLFDYLYDVCADIYLPEAQLCDLLEQDFIRSGLKSRPRFLHDVRGQTKSLSKSLADRKQHISRQARR